MDSHLRLRQLIYFLEAARNGSLAKAADALNVSQPAVTKTIRELETTLDAQLFLRSRGGVVLTACGEALFDHATAAVAELNAGLNRIKALKKGEEGRLTVGAVAVAGSHLLRTAVARMKRDNPYVTVTVVPGTIDRLLPALRLGEIDLVIGRPGEPEMMQGIAHEVLFDDRLALVTRAHHPLVARQALTLSDLIRFPWVMPLPNTPTRERLDAAFRDRGLPLPPNVIEGVVSAFTYDYVERTNSIAALPLSVVAEDIRSGRLAELALDMIQELGAIRLMRRENIALSEPARRFIRELRRLASRMREHKPPTPNRSD